MHYLKCVVRYFIVHINFINVIFNIPETDWHVKAFGFSLSAWRVSLRRAVSTLLTSLLVLRVLCAVSFQVINNACATQAIVSVLLNCSHSDMLLGDTLTEFREFSQSFDAAVSSRYISESWDVKMCLGLSCSIILTHVGHLQLIYMSHYRFPHINCTRLRGALSKTKQSDQDQSVKLYSMPSH